MIDVLILGPIQFDSYSTPERMGFGGRHAMAVVNSIHDHTLILVSLSI
ncbi:hypothetical protein SAMN05444581_105129 [Methylocapsa palsarum]|uniref:Uncharacterized protein n=1 Tax=Methylocapsa palsarum TaxID=1612308 RepID=A0A1I3YBZ3_9HYPH|nr:hypothetical protein SAMN05444581_105129 [Methylocapsa palsarum]